MIFVSMNDKDLIARTSHYRLRSHSLTDWDSDGDSSVPSSTTSENRPVSRRHDSVSRTVPPPISNNMAHISFPSMPLALGTSSASSRRLGETWNLTARQESITAENATRPGLSSSPRPSLPPNDGFNVTTHCDQPSEDEVEESSPQTLADRFEREQLQREHILPSFSPTSDEDAEDALGRAVRARRVGVPPHQLPSRRRGRRRDSPSRVEVSLDEDERLAGGDLLAPHARFFIDREKSNVTISFDPPV